MKQKNKTKYNKSPWQNIHFKVYGGKIILMPTYH